MNLTSYQKEMIETCRAIVEKIQKDDGTPISDQELEIAIMFYGDLELMLSFMGREFHLAWKEVMLKSQELRQFKFWREQK